MKRTDLAKLKGLRLKPQAGVPGANSPFGKAAPAAPSRREQRELDRASGLVPFAVKLNEALVKALDDPGTKKRLLDLGGVLPEGKERTSAWLGEYVAQEVARWTPILKAGGIVAPE